MKTPELVSLDTINRLVDSYQEPKIILSKSFIGWYATTDNYDGPGSPVGWGMTKDEALSDLMEQMG